MRSITLPDGSKIVYDETGLGAAALVMIHGYTGGRWYYENEVNTFSAQWRCIAPDLVGHGESDKPLDRDYCVERYARDVSDIADALGLESFVLIGHSMGGMVAQRFALDHNEKGRCVGMVLISTSSELPLRDMIAASLREEIGRYERGEWSYNENLQRSLAKSAWSDRYADEHPEQVERAYEETLRVPEIVRMKLMLAMAEKFDVASRVKDIRIPTLVCVGSQDMLRDGSKKLAENIPGAKFRVFEGAGHMINIEAAEAIRKEIYRFLNPFF